MKRYGHTLLEVLVVFIIMAMALAISIPLFSNFLKSTRLDTTAREITSTLRLARSYAITNNAEYKVVFEKIAGNYTSKYWIENNSGNVVEKKYSLPGTISFDEVQMSLNEVTFKPSGGATTKSSIWIRERGGQTKQITVINVTGRVEVQ